MTILSEWIKACNLEQVKEAFGFVHDDKKIESIHATDLIYMLMQTFLLDFLVKKTRCPLHLSVFNLDSKSFETPLKVYNVKIDDNEIYVEV